MASITQGPLADGIFTLGDLKRVLMVTATPAPPITDEASDDGLLHWVADGRPPENPWLGDNPYCE